MLVLGLAATSYEAHSRQLVWTWHDVMIEKQLHVSVDFRDEAIQQGDLNLSLHNLVKAIQRGQQRRVGQNV